jgi:hypothetical protein
MGWSEADLKARRKGEPRKAPEGIWRGCCTTEAKAD